MAVKDAEFAVLKEKVHDMSEDVKLIRKVLIDGNGHEPLVTTVRMNAKQVQHIPGILTFMNKTKGGMIAIWSAISLFGISGIVALFRLL